MAKVEIKRIEANTARKIGRKGTSVATKRVRQADGSTRTIRTIDANSPTLAADLTYVFGMNVAEARRENKRIVGVEDFVPEKL
jgi:hypothetical protein